MLFMTAGLVLFIIAKVIYHLFNSSTKVAHQLTEEDNLAYFIAYIGYFLGILMVIGGVMMSEGSGSFWTELTYTFIYGLIGMISLNLGALFIDKVVHPKTSLKDEIINNKVVSLGILKGVNYLSTGIITGGVLLTEVDKPFQAIIFLTAALVVASLGTLYYNIITPFNINKYILGGNIAVALSTAGAQIAFAILIYSGFQLYHTDWLTSMKSVGIDMIGGFIMLPVIRLVVDKVYLPNHSLTDEMINQETPNIGAGLFEGASYVAGSLLFVWCWNL